MSEVFVDTVAWLALINTSDDQSTNHQSTILL
jgi:hypothetical protein